MCSVSPVALARQIAGYLAELPVHPDAVKRAQRFVRRRRDLRGEPPARKGHEYVVEALLRPLITRQAANILGLGSGRQLFSRIYSSHYHTTTGSEALWRQRWTAFRRAYPSVDTRDASQHSRRADLFIAVGAADLVSIEFKYVGPKRTPSVASCVKQMRQHVSGHAASILVIYGGGPTSSRLREAVRAIERDLESAPARVVLIEGPEITFPPPDTPATAQPGPSRAAQHARRRPRLRRRTSA